MNLCRKNGLLRDASEKKRKADENHGCGPGRPRRAEENNNQRLVEGEEEEEKKVVHAMSHISTSELTFPLRAELEWRSNYWVGLSKDWWSGSISATEKHPWYSSFGIYSHYHTQVIDGTTVR